MAWYSGRKLCISSPSGSKSPRLAIMRSTTPHTTNTIKYCMRLNQNAEKPPAVAGFVPGFEGEGFLAEAPDFSGISDFSGFEGEALGFFESFGSALVFKFCKSSCRLRLFVIFFFAVFFGLSSPLPILQGQDSAGMHGTQLSSPRGL